MECSRSFNMKSIYQSCQSILGLDEIGNLAAQDITTTIRCSSTVMSYHLLVNCYHNLTIHIECYSIPRRLAPMYASSISLWQPLARIRSVGIALLFMTVYVNARIASDGQWCCHDALHVFKITHNLLQLITKWTEPSTLSRGRQTLSTSAVTM